MSKTLRKYNKDGEKLRKSAALLNNLDPITPEQVEEIFDVHLQKALNFIPLDKALLYALSAELLKNGSCLANVVKEAFLVVKQSDAYKRNLSRITSSKPDIRSMSDCIILSKSEKRVLTNIFTENIISKASESVISEMAAIVDDSFVYCLEEVRKKMTVSKSFKQFRLKIEVLDILIASREKRQELLVAMMNSPLKFGIFRENEHFIHTNLQIRVMLNFKILLNRTISENEEFSCERIIESMISMPTPQDKITATSSEEEK